MDAMEELDGMDMLTGSNPAIQPECHMLGKGVVPGLRYRHLGKSGLKVTFVCLHQYIYTFLLKSLSAWFHFYYRYNGNYYGIIEVKTLQVSSIGLGSLKAFSSEDCELNEELITLGNFLKQSSIFF